MVDIIKKVNRRQKNLEQWQRARRMRKIRIGGIVVLANAALGVLGFYRTSTAPASAPPSKGNSGPIMTASMSKRPSALSPDQLKS